MGSRFNCLCADEKFYFFLLQQTIRGDETATLTHDKVSVKGAACMLVNEKASDQPKKPTVYSIYSTADSSRSSWSLPYCLVSAVHT